MTTENTYSQGDTTRLMFVPQQFYTTTQAQKSQQRNDLPWILPNLWRQNRSDCLVRCVLCKEFAVFTSFNTGFSPKPSKEEYKDSGNLYQCISACSHCFLSSTRFCVLDFAVLLLILVMLTVPSTNLFIHYQVQSK